MRDIVSPRSGGTVGEASAVSSSETRIVGILLARDEDVWVERAVLSVAAFCDELILCDHRSRDATPEILRRLASRHADMSYVRIRHPRESHELIKSHAGTRTWVLSVDGDEIYDPVRLAAFKARLLGGEFDQWWAIRLSMLHCAILDLDAGSATGWLTPPARSGTKLFNFGAISSWEGKVPERLHGGTPVFRPFGTSATYNMGEHHPWNEAPFRCLHLCFLHRSSRQSPREIARPSYGDSRSGSPARRAWRTARRWLGRPEPSWWKLTKYRQGELVTVLTQEFFGPDANGRYVSGLLTSHPAERAGPSGRGDPPAP